MRILRLIQGGPEWHQHRATRFNASDAPAMLGESPHMTREQLLRRMVTGLAPEVDAGTQQRFDDGHAVEVLLRAQAEKMLGEPLYPFVGVPDDESSLLSASYDGSTFVGDTTVECKLLNARLRAAFADMETIAPAHREKSAAKCLPIDYRIQLEQQVRVAQSERALFLAGELRDDGTLGDTFSCWYYPDDALWTRIDGGWTQLAVDRATYAPREATPAAVAAPIEALPAISARIEGSLIVHSNLDAFGQALRAFVAKIPAKPTTDQEFADCDAACKALKRAEEALDGAEANALGQVQTVEMLTRTIADLRSVARTARLASEKMVKARKEQIRVEEVQRGQKALVEFIDGLNATIGKLYMPTVAADFAGAISGKKTLESLRNAIDTELARAKIEANGVCGRIVVNLRTLRELAADYAFLFADTATLVLKAEDDCRAVIESRIAAHKAAEEKRLEAERERIRREEQAKLAAEEVQRQQQANREAAARQAEIDRQAAEAAKPAPSPAPAPIAAPALSSKPAAANSPSVVPITRARPTLRLGEIGERLGLGVSEAFLQRMGFPVVEKHGPALMYHEADFDRICDSLVAHIRTAQEIQRRESQQVA